MPRKSQEELEEDIILSNSIERVINTTLHILEKLNPNRDMVSINQQDWIELKEVTVRIWNEKRNEIFKKRLEKK